jgi:DeoR/GlpR family transcriptional regulator of sugar metabolism
MCLRTSPMYTLGMDASERVGRLVEALRRDGRVEVTRAAVEFGAAEMTIRRDLDQLVERGVALRVRGGAINLLMCGEELPFAMREIEAVEAKRRIAGIVADLIRDGEMVGLDSGTTVLETARAMVARRVMVMPFSLHAATVMAAGSGVRLMMPGGDCRPGELAMVGPLALASIAAVRFDTVVLGSCGVSQEGQVMAHDLGDAAVKQAMLASARRSVLALEGAKFGRGALAVVQELSRFDVVVTDTTAPDLVLAGLRAGGVEVHVA